MSNEPEKVDISFFEEIEAMNEEMHKIDEEVTFKGKLRYKGLFPTLKGDILSIYEIKPTEATTGLMIRCRENLFDVYRKITNDREYMNKFFYNSSKYPEFRNILDNHDSTKEELIEYYKLKTDEDKNNFLSLPQNEMFKFDRDMSFDEIIEAMAPHYMTFNFKRPSKISEIIYFLSHYFDADYAASVAYRILNIKDMDFYYGVNSVEPGQEKINRMAYTIKEDRLPYSERLDLLKQIYDSFDIKCVYSSNVNDMTDFIFENIFKTTDKKMVLDFAKHNYNLLHNSEFSDDFKKISSIDDCEFNIEFNDIAYMVSIIDRLNINPQTEKELIEVYSNGLRQFKETGETNILVTGKNSLFNYLSNNFTSTASFSDDVKRYLIKK